MSSPIHGTRDNDRVNSTMRKDGMFFSKDRVLVRTSWCLGAKTTEGHRVGAAFCDDGGAFNLFEEEIKFTVLARDPHDCFPILLSKTYD